MGIARGKLNYDHFGIACRRRLEDRRHRSTGRYHGAAPEDINYMKTGPTNWGTSTISNPPNPPATVSPSTWAPRTTSPPTTCRQSLAVTDSGFIRVLEQEVQQHRPFVRQWKVLGVIVDENGQSEQPDFDLNILEFTPTARRAFRRCPRIDQRRTRIRGMAPCTGIGLLYTARVWSTRPCTTSPDRSTSTPYAGSRFRKLLGDRQP